MFSSTHVPVFLIKKYDTIWKKVRLFSRVVTKPTMRMSIFEQISIFFSNLQYSIQVFFYVSQKITHDTRWDLTEILDFSYFWGNFELFWANFTFFSQLYTMIPTFVCSIYYCIVFLTKTYTRVGDFDWNYRFFLILM